MGNRIITPSHPLFASAKRARPELEDRARSLVSSNQIIRAFAHVPIRPSADVPGMTELDVYSEMITALTAQGDLSSWVINNPRVFAHRFGASPEQLKAAAAHLESLGLKVGRISMYNGEIAFSGSPSDMQKLIPNLALRNVVIDGKPYRYRSGIHEVNAPVGMFRGISGLDNTPIAHNYALLANPNGVASPFTPLQLMGPGFYNVPGTTGLGQHIGVIALDGGANPTLYQNYARQVLGLSPTAKVKVNVKLIDGAKGRPDPQGADIETNLDVCGALGAYEAEITVFIGVNTTISFAHLIAAAVSAGCNIITISWGSTEANFTQQGMNTMHIEFQRALAAQISVFAAAGDNLDTDTQGGGDDGDGDSSGSSPLNVDYPGSDPYVMAGIGIWLSSDGKTARLWNNTDSGTGGGVSDFWDLQGWETLKTVSLKDGGSRHIVGGLAFPGDPATGIYCVDDNGRKIGVGGTSANGPVAAGMTARCNQKLGKNLGFFLPLVAANRSQLCRIVTVGNNAAPGVPGYNAADIAYGMLDFSALLEKVSA